MNRYEEFESKYELDKPMYKEWGNYVYKQIIQGIGLSKIELEKIIKIPVIPRVKDTASIIQKAFFRGKHYQDPYNEITDKVGIRFVVMIIPQIRIIKECIEKNTNWRYSKDKDFEEESTNYPSVFGYESVHCIVRAVEDINSNGIIIRKDTPCEVQIRTLEQHAYAELSHDYFYKSKIKSTGKDIMSRYLARGMALNETTDFLFEEVYNMIEEGKKEYYKWNSFLRSIMVFPNYNEELDRSIFLNIESLIDKYISFDDIKKFIEEDIKKYIAERNKNTLFQQPMVLLIYFLANSHGTELLSIWDGTEEMLEPIFVDLGISIRDIY